MKKLVLATLILMTSNIYAWSVKSRDGVFVLEKDKTVIEVESVGGIPRYIKEVKLNKNYRLIVYYSGTAGTSSLVSIERAVIFNTKLKKSLGDYAYKYSSDSSKLIQPKWKYDEQTKVLKVIDEESGDDAQFTLE